ncbi:hypothetical protein MD484_g4305, partial [Candolleomyces efflorescens]
MSMVRAALVVVQALCNGLACTPPNPTPKERRYHTEEMYILQIAPLIFKCHHIITWTCAIFEVLYYLRTLLPQPPPSSPFTGSLASTASTLICPSSPTPNVVTTPFFIIGVLAVVLGCYIRLDCFRTLGEMFTFDLTIHPQHKLVTHRFYAYVRHPAYTGSLLLVFGLAFSHLTRGSWMTECGPLRTRMAAGVVWAVWWGWTLCVGVSRAEAEDRQMKKLFRKEWEMYAKEVQWWFFPGLL